MNKLILSTLVSAGLAAAPLAFAQSAADTAQPRHQAQRHHEQHPFSLPGERIEARLAYLKTALKITDAQLPQWEAFANTLRKHAQESDQRIAARRTQMAHHGHHDTQATAIERLERRQARLAATSQRLSETLAAAKPLYASLTPEQQKVADEVLAAPRRGMRHGPMRGRA